MIVLWEKRDDYWMSTISPGFYRDLIYRGNLEIGSKRGHGSKRGRSKRGQVFILAIEADSSLSRNKDTICISNKYGLSWVAS